MSISILSIPLGIISIIVFVWSMNSAGAKPQKGKKKDNDAMIIGVIVSVLLFFVSLGIFDAEESTAGLFGSEQSAQEQSRHRSERNSEKSEAQREVEEYNKAAVEKARHGDKEQSDSHNSDSSTSKVNDTNDDKNLEKQRQAYQQWHNQVEAKIQSIDTIWSALWNDNSPESIEKLMKVLDKEQSELSEITVPAELSMLHRQILTDAMSRYYDWINSYRQACQMKSKGNAQQDIINELAKGDGFKLRSNVEISNVGRELDR